jgi:hypothetical protein
MGWLLAFFGRKTDGSIDSLDLRNESSTPSNAALELYMRLPGCSAFMNPFARTDEEKGTSRSQHPDDLSRSAIAWVV